MINVPVTQSRLPGSQPNYLKRRAIFAGSIIGLLFLIFFIHDYLTTTRLSIKSEDGALISVSPGKGAPFEQIGTGSATYTSNDSISLFIKAELDDRATQKNVHIEAGSRESIQLQLNSAGSATKISDTSLSHLFLQGDFLYGISPSTRAVGAAQTRESNKQPPLFLDLPFLSRISWIDEKNFIFNSLRYGVGVYAGGSLSERLSLSDTSPAFGDFSIYPGKPLVLMAGDGLYTSANFGRTTKKITEKIPTGVIRIFSNESNIYYVSTISPETHEGSSTIDHITEVQVYNYSGRMVNEVVINEDVGNPIRLLPLPNNQVCLLTDEYLVFVDMNTKSIEKHNYHDERVEDIVLTENGELLLFGTSGLWTYDQSSEDFYLIYGMAEGEEYVPSSLTIIDNETLFSVQLSKAALRDIRRTSSNAVYKVSY